MVRRGKTSAGTQRWICKKCQKSAVWKNKKSSFRYRRNLFNRWICGNLSLEDLAKIRSLSSRTLQRWFKPFWEYQPNSPIPDSLSNQILIVDAVSIEPRRGMALIGRTPEKVIHWIFAKHECHESWVSFCSMLPSPKAVVCDGQRGLSSAIKQCWPQALFQRCLIHVIRQALTRLTLHPKTFAGKKLRLLVKELSGIRTKRQKRRWVRQWNHWNKKQHSFLSERTYGESPNKRRGWWYTHKKIRAVRSLIQNSLSHLFTFIKNPEIPRTSNYVEGGINSRLKELLHRHRGLSLPHKQTLTSYFLFNKSIKKTPRNVV